MRLAVDSYFRPRLPVHSTIVHGSEGKITPDSHVFQELGERLQYTLFSFDEQVSGGVILVLNAGPELHPAGEYLSKKETYKYMHCLSIPVSSSEAV